MSKLLKHAKKFFLSKTVIVIIIILIIVGVIIVKKSTNTGIAGIQTAVASVGNVVEQVSVTGTVSPISSADLAFEKGGVVEQINVAVGDQVKAGDAIASLDSS